MAAKFYPPKPPASPVPQKPVFPINLDEIAKQPGKAIESAFQATTSAPPSLDNSQVLDEQQIASRKLVDQQKLAQVRAQIQRIDAEVEEARAKREQQPQATSRLSQDQPSSSQEEESALANPPVVPSAPKRHLFPGQIASQKKAQSQGGIETAIQRKVTKSETRAKIAGA